MNTPITLDYANERLGLALKSENTAEIEKWDFITRNENETRIRHREKDRAIKNNLLRIALRKSYTLPAPLKAKE